MRAITAGAASFSEPWLRPNPHGVSRHLALVRGFNVLLVDDNHHHRIPLLRALRHQGHSVLHAADGASGETLCRASQLEIDALIACADMKRMCGFELARRVARVRPEVRVLLMGRHLGPEEAHRAYERGYAVIEEPFTPEQLCHRLTGLLGSPRNDTGAEPRLVAGDRLIPREDHVLAIGSRKKNAPPRGSSHGTEPEPRLHRRPVGDRAREFAPRKLLLVRATPFRGASTLRLSHLRGTAFDEAIAGD
jgi:CheY-like chemotaxis protein